MNIETIEMGFKGHGMSDEEVDDAVQKLNKVVDNTEEGEGAESDSKITLTKNAIEKIISVTNKTNKLIRVFLNFSRLKKLISLKKEHKDIKKISKPKPIVKYRAIYPSI